MQCHKFLVSCLLFLFLAQPGIAQKVASALPGNDYRQACHVCDSISRQSMREIPVLFDVGADSLTSQVCSAWELSCGMAEPLFSFLVLRSIRSRTFSDSLYTLKDEEPTLNNAQADYYRTHLLLYLKKYAIACNFRLDRMYGNITGDSLSLAYLEKKYYAFLKNFAAKLSAEQGLSPIEQFLVSFYANPQTDRLVDLGKPAYKGTEAYRQVRAARKKALHQLQDSRGLHIGFDLSAWYPQGSFSSVGNFGGLGLYAGGNYKKLYYDFGYWVTTGSSRQFAIHYHDSLVAATSSGGVVLFARCAYELWRSYRQGIETIGGAGFNYFGSERPNKVNDLAVFISPDVFAGLGYKLFVSSHFNESRYSYKALEWRFLYHGLFYKNPGGTDISGGAFSISLSITGYMSKL